MQRLLDNNAEYLNSILEATSIALFIWDIDDDEIFWSSSARKILNIDEHQTSFQIRDFLKNVHKNDYPILADALEQAEKSNEHIFVQCRYSHDEGQYKWIQIHGALQNHKKTNNKQMIGRIADVQNEILIEQNLTVLQEALDTGSWRYDVSLDKLTWSKEVYKIHELDDVDKPIDVNEAMKFFVKGPQGQDKIEHVFKQAIDEGKNYQVEAKIKTAKGRILDIYSKGFCEYDEHGKTLAVWGIVKDVTLEIAQKKELEDYRENLERLVDKKTADLEKAVEEVQLANQAKDDFLARMSHELRTPLNSIIGLTSILAEEKLNNKQEKYISTIQLASQSLLSLVNDILDISKIESGGMKIEYAPMSLMSVIKSVTSQIEAIALHKNLDFHCETENIEEINVYGDAPHLSQIIMNVLGNAVKYTLEGSINMHAELVKQEDTELYDFNIEVKDTGIGIAKDKIDTIFDRFSQVDETNARVFGGSGLGLNIAKQLIEKMKGTIEVTSKENVGSCFKVSIPFEVAPTSHLNQTLSDHIFPPPVDDFHRLDIKKAKILIAEDNEFNIIFAKELLANLDCENFDIAPDGKQAVELYKDQGDYDIILMDCHMPEMNGYEATKTIRRYEVKKQIDRVPIIAISADAMRNTKLECLEAGMDGFLSKPLSIQDFTHYLSAWIDFGSRYKDELSSSDNLNAQIIDLSLLKDYADNDEDKLKSLLSLFHKKSCQDILALKELVSDENDKSWRETAHSLKGSASYIGAQLLYSYCEQAQEGEDQTAEKRQDLLNSIVSEHDKICRYLKEKNYIE